MGLLSEVLAAFSRWRRGRRTVAALSDLEDHRLIDLGIERWQIAAIAEACSRSSAPPPGAGADTTVAANDQHRRIVR